MFKKVWLIFLITILSVSSILFAEGDNCLPQIAPGEIAKVDSMGPNGEFVPQGYVLARDEDFAWETGWLENLVGYNVTTENEKGLYRYIGTHDYVTIPHKINGNLIVSYECMFAFNQTVKGVASNNLNVTNISHMFFNAYSVTSLDLSYLDTSNVETMFGMFYRCSALEELNISTWNPTEMYYVDFAFIECENLENKIIEVANDDLAELLNISLAKPKGICFFYREVR